MKTENRTKKKLQVLMFKQRLEIEENAGTPQHIYHSIWKCEKNGKSLCKKRE